MEQVEHFHLKFFRSPKGTDMKEIPLSTCERSSLVSAVEAGLRYDNREFLEVRDTSLNFGKDYGSCTATLGQTRVLAQVRFVIRWCYYTVYINRKIYIDASSTTCVLCNSRGMLPVILYIASFCAPLLQGI